MKLTTLILAALLTSSLSFAENGHKSSSGNGNGGNGQGQDNGAFGAAGYGFGGSGMGSFGGGGGGGDAKYESKRKDLTEEFSKMGDDAKKGMKENTKEVLQSLNKGTQETIKSIEKQYSKDEKLDKDYIEQVSGKGILSANPLDLSKKYDELVGLVVKENETATKTVVEFGKASFAGKAPFQEAKPKTENEKGSLVTDIKTESAVYDHSSTSVNKNPIAKIQRVTTSEEKKSTPKPIGDGARGITSLEGAYNPPKL
jgi:hypothetical protein